MDKNMDDIKLSERVRSLEHRLLQKGRELSLLKEMSLFLITSVQKTLDLLAYRMGILTNAKFVRVYLVDKTSTKLRLVSGYNLSERYLEMVKDRLEISIDAAPCGKAVSDKAPYVVNDVNKDDAFSMWRDVTAMHGYSSYVAMPLMVSDRILGVADVFFEDIKYFTDDELNLMSVISNTGALAIENAILIETIENTSIVDEDTGAYNRRHFMETLKKELERAKRYEQALSIVMMKIAGVAAGEDFSEASELKWNEELSLFIREVKNRVRGTDMIFRYSDDTFCLILTHTPKKESAEVVVTRLHETFFKLFAKTKELKIGISGMPDDGDNIEAIIKKASIQG